MALTTNPIFKPNPSTMAPTTRLPYKSGPTIGMVDTLKLLWKTKTYQKLIVANMTNLYNQGNFALDSNTKNANTIAPILLLIIW